MAEQYLPLYRKYRPQKFSDLIGQDNLVKAMENAINTGKIAHAYLFCGPRGTGKTSSARILAKSLNCQNGPTMTPCEECICCKDILNGNMLDVVEMDAASNRSVEDAQNIIDKIHYAPVNAKYKIFIIDEVHMISKQAFNALLKTLEEPPENVIFILATTEPQKVLETIISRCQRFDFRRITVDDIVKRLKYVSEQEKIKISDDALYTIAKSSQGGMRDALALLDQISVLDMEKEITSKDVNDILGKIDTETLLKISQSIMSGSVDVSIQTINDIYAKGNEPVQIIENFLQFYRNLSIAKTCSDTAAISKLTLLSKDEINEMKKHSEAIDISKISSVIEKLTQYHKEIKLTNNRYLWLELCFIDLASPEIKCVAQQTIQPTNVINKPKIEIPAQKPVEQKKPEEKPIAETVKIEEQKETVTETPVQQVATTQKSSGNTWKDITSLIKSPPSKSFFETFAKPVELTDKKVVITFKDTAIQERAKENPKFDAFKTACLNYFNVLSIEVEMKVGVAPNITNKEPNIIEPKGTKQTIKQPTIEDSQPIDDDIVDEISDDIDTETFEPQIELTDEAEMVKRMFDAKILED